jgi:hypothetical protein
MFYTYLWLRDNGTPYYVGKGKGRRAFVRNDHKQNPPTKDRIVIQSFVSESDAFDAEKFLIDYYGRLNLGTGCLRNLTDGGENPPNHKGLKRSKSTREKISTYQRSKTISDKALRNMTEARRLRATKQALCHLSREHKAKGFCAQCYRHLRHVKAQEKKCQNKSL